MCSLYFTVAVRSKSIIFTIKTRKIHEDLMHIYPIFDFSLLYLLMRREMTVNRLQMGFSSTKEQLLENDINLVIPSTQP